MEGKKKIEFEPIIQSLVSDISGNELEKDNEFTAVINSFCVDLIKKENQRNNELTNLDFIIPNLATETETLIKKEYILSKKTKARFNVFDCLTKHHLEQLHTNFLSYLLNVKKEHDCGKLFLSEFIEVLKDEYPEIRDFFSNLQLNLLSARIIPQKFIGRSYDNPEIYGFPDIFIEIPTNDPQFHLINIAIENKIRAIEQIDQIKRYILYCKDRLLNYNEKYLVLYLTLDGKKSNEAGDECYYCISYKKTILDWLDRIHNKTNKYPLVHSGILFYKKMLESNILHLPSNKVIMKIIDILLKKENLIFLKYKDEIIKTMQEIHDKLRKDFFEKVTIELGKRYKVVPVKYFIETISVSEIWGDDDAGLNIEDEQYTYHINGTDKIVLSIEHSDVNIYYGLVGIKTENEKNTNWIERSTLPILKSIDETLRHKSQYSDEQPELMWLTCKCYYPLKNGIGFSSESLNYDFATNLDEIVFEFVKEIEQYLEIWKETINEIKRT